MGFERRMMDTKERFDIYVPQEVKSVLESDAGLFFFFKKDRTTVNMNRFLTTVIREYHGSYISEQIDTLSQIASEIRDIIPDEKKRMAVAQRVCDQLLFSVTRGNRAGKKERISLKPTREIQQIIRSIPDTELPDASVSKYFCRLFISYANKPISLRERIVFFDKLTVLEDACKNGWNLDLETALSDEIHHVIPYCVSTGKEELFNYLLCVEVRDGGKDKAATYRLNRISWISKSTSGNVITPEMQRNLARMVKNSPLYSVNDDPLIRIRMAGKGKALYRKIYYGRPDYCGISEEKDGTAVYSFDCSVPQALFYFRRFDQDAIDIIEPQELKDQMRTVFSRAIEPLELDR